MRSVVRQLLISAILASGAAASAQDLDPSFGSAGFVLAPRSTMTGATTVRPGALAPAEGGGYWWAMSLASTTIALGRIDANGSPDAALGGGAGRVELSDCVGNGELELLPATNGRVVLWTGRCLQLRKQDGSLDPTFAALGSVTVGDLGSARLLRDSLGRFVLAGSAANEWHAFRLHADGSLDASFGAGGHVVPAVPATNGLRGLTSLAIRGDDSIVLAGWRGNTHGPSLVLFGLTATGEPDPGFGTAGLVDVPHQGGDNTVRAHDIATLADGSVVLAGERGSGSVACCVLFARFSRAGVLDPSLGLRAFPLGNDSLPPFFEMRAAILPTSDGGAWIARTSFPFTPPGHRTQLTLIRVAAAGALDTAFAGRGWRSWFVNLPATSTPAGDYIQLHDTLFAAGTIAFFGRTFFEDDGSSNDYVTFARVLVDSLLIDGFE